MNRKLLLAAVAGLAMLGCTKESVTPSRPVRPSILFVTLDTTRYDAIGPEAKSVSTPSFNALVPQGRRFRWAYATVPQTLPSHTSMLTGLYPGGHGIRENGRSFSAKEPLLAEKLHDAGYRTAAFVSAFALARRFGLARGFDVYDDDFGTIAERNAQQTTDRVLAYLKQPANEPRFLWVHYWDPHYPYTPPEPFRSQYAKQPYYGEIAFMDQQLGRLIAAFRQGAKSPIAIVIVGDHGEGLGEHGEQQHGNLLYQATVHVPLLLIGPGITPGVSDVPVSTRRVFHTMLDWAGVDSTNSLCEVDTSVPPAPHSDHEVVAGEAMKPFLDYGWQPQVMAVEGRQKAILASRIEVYDVVSDPDERHDLAATATLPRDVRATLQQYPIPTLEVAAAATGFPAISEADRRKLASLGYVASEVKPVVRKDAPRPADMAALFPILDEAAALFVREEYGKAIPLLEQILARDPHNLDAALRLATSHSSLGHDRQAIDAFQRAQAIAPDSPDVRTYLALHYARGKDWKKAEPMLEQIVAQWPDRVPALEALAMIREREGRIDESLALRQKLYALRTPNPGELVHLGVLAMQMGQTNVAIDAFEKARAAEGSAFRNDLELGVLYLAANRLDDARNALDRVPASSPGYPMALFKRAQVSVLLHEPDAAARIDAARAHADAGTRELIARERLFR
jgi:arylsulfatase A-like enzyme/Tfp pilus assembly protein PilF